MNIEPVASYPEPAYPQRDELPPDHCTKDSFIPEVWRRTALITGAVLAFSAFTCQAAVHGDQSLQDSKTAVSFSQVNIEAPAQTDLCQWLLAAAEYGNLVAPLFLHGSGTGASGGIAGRPLTSLTEGEARNIIEKELKAAGIVFDRHNVEMEGIFVEKEPAGTKVPLITDGIDSSRNIAYEYVPAKDYECISRMQKGMITEVNYPVLAERVREAFIRAGSVNTVVFYDPLPGDADRKEAARMLKAQVLDFIAWARGKGLIK